MEKAWPPLKSVIAQKRNARAFIENNVSPVTLARFAFEYCLETGLLRRGRLAVGRAQVAAVVQAAPRGDAFMAQPLGRIRVHSRCCCVLVDSREGVGRSECVCGVCACVATSTPTPRERCSCCVVEKLMKIEAQAFSNHLLQSSQYCRD